jgi:biotin transport system substrate-specific component
MTRSTSRLVAASLMAALTAVCSQIQIPLPAVPLSLSLFAVHLSGALLGPLWGTVSQGVYVLLGLAGVPVFAGLRAGPPVLFGNTGGYLVGYLLSAFTTGWAASRLPFRLPHLALGMAAGTLLCYAFGTAWFMVLTRLSLSACLGACVVPFLPGDAVKILLAASLALRLRAPLSRAGFPVPGEDPSAARRA